MSPAEVNHARSGRPSFLPDETALRARAVEFYGTEAKPGRLHGTLADQHTDDAGGWSELGKLLLSRRSYPEAEVACRHAIEVRPDSVEAHFTLVATLEAMGRCEDAVPIYLALIRLQPARADLRSSLAHILERLGRLEEAAENHREAATLEPLSVLHAFNRGRVLGLLGRVEAAIAAYRAALAIEPEAVEVLSSLGSALVGLKRYEEAADAGRRAFELRPNHAPIANNYAVVLHQQGRVAEAARIYGTVVATDPDYHGAWANLGIAYQELFRFDDAVDALERAVALRPDSHASLVELIKIRRHVCDWTHYAEDHARLLALIEQPSDAVFMLLLMAFPSTPEQQLACARQHMRQFNAVSVKAVAAERLPIGRSLRVGYLSADYRDHPVGRLLPEMLAQHDRSRIEIFGYALGVADPGRVRRRIARACDHFIYLHHLSDDDATARIRADHIDVLVDLTGPMTGARMGILAQRPAPVQVSFLGWPGTMGAGFVDYVIGDPFLTPAQHQAHYAEKLVQMPICYQPSDPYRAVSVPELQRADCGLPDDAFVFCSFNNTSKLTPDLFDHWLRVLSKTGNSVLWLYSKTPKTIENLRGWAGSRGIAAERIIFTSVAPMDVYLGRMRIADLFLDSYPYNAGATCNDALWVGLPVLTCVGDSYVSRMAGSLLRAAELPELISENLDDYEARAVRLATEPGVLATLRQRLVRRRDSLPVFDLPRFTMSLETALHHMHDLWAAGRTPEGFSVA